MAEVSARMPVSAKSRINIRKARYSENYTKCYKENTTFRTVYNMLLSYKGFPPVRKTSNFVECSECLIFIVLMLYFAEAGMWADTSTVVFSVAAFSNGVFLGMPIWQRLIKRGTQE